MIDELIDILIADGKVSDKEAFRGAVLHREEEFSTGIGMGHRDSPWERVMLSMRASIVFGRSDAGIDYESMV